MNGLMELRLFVVLAFYLSLVNSFPETRVKMADVKTLTLTQGAQTTHRRVDPVPQLTCLGGSAGCSVTPRVVQCYNRGFDGANYQWECKAEMPKHIIFGQVKVGCEGYENSKDEYILAGSCALKYYLEKNPDVNVNTGGGGGFNQNAGGIGGNNFNNNNSDKSSKAKSYLSTIIGVVVGVVILCICLAICIACLCCTACKSLLCGCCDGKSGGGSSKPDVVYHPAPTGPTIYNPPPPPPPHYNNYNHSGGYSSGSGGYSGNTGGYTGNTGGTSANTGGNSGNTGGNSATHESSGFGTTENR